MDTTTYKLLEPDVLAAAKTVAWKWPGVIQEDDLRQEIWLRILEAGTSTTDKLLEMDQPLRLSSLSQIGHQIAAKERDDYDLFSGNFFYSTHHVRALLEEDALVHLENQAGTLMHSERFDLQVGMEKLRHRSAVHTHLIEQVYVRGYVPKDGGERKELTRAVDSLTREMNRSNRSQIVAQHDGPGSRKAMSNESAIRMTRNDYRGA